MRLHIGAVPGGSAVHPTGVLAGLRLGAEFTEVLVYLQLGSDAHSGEVLDDLLAHGGPVRDDPVVAQTVYAGFEAVGESRVGQHLLGGLGIVGIGPAAVLAGLTVRPGNRRPPVLPVGTPGGVLVNQWEGLAVVEDLVKLVAVYGVVEGQPNLGVPYRIVRVVGIRRALGTASGGRLARVRVHVVHLTIVDERDGLVDAGEGWPC